MRIPEAVEDRWLRDYLERRLTGAEAASFEAYAMTREHLLRTIELDTKLRDALFLACRTASSCRTGRRSSRVTHRRRRIRGHVSLSSSASVRIGRGFLCARSHRPLDEPLVAPILRQTMRVEHVDTPSSYVIVEVSLPLGAGSPTAKVDRFPAPSLVLSLDRYADLLVQRTFPGRSRSSAPLKYDGHSVLLSLDLSSPWQAPK